MAFRKATASTSLQNGGALSADNSYPERHIVIETLRNAAPLLGLSATVISTLDAMLSCLAPNRNHHIVFASNNTLTFRRNGISDRTIRRHAATLQDNGLLLRCDSPNKKRFTKRNAHDGLTLRFGFDLSPLFSRFKEIAAMAADVLRDKEKIDYIRTKIRAAANHCLESDPDNTDALSALRALRRKLTLSDCCQILEELPTQTIFRETSHDQHLTTSTKMATSDGHFVRHHQNSKKELIDKEGYSTAEQSLETTSENLSVNVLLETCTEAAQFLLRKITTESEVVAHARTLAPMLGIDAKNYEAAQNRLGPFKTAVTVWAIMQFHTKIRAVGAYFRAITTGTRSSGFDPERLIARLATM